MLKVLLPYDNLTMKLSLFAALTALATTAVDASTLTPPVLPLLVRNPYLNFWLPRARDVPWHAWPMFYTGSTVGFAIMARTESGAVYPLLGRPQDFVGNSRSFGVEEPEYHGASYDASTTNLTYTLGGSEVKVTLSFLSPITPTSIFRQSIPASYLNVFVEGFKDVSIFIDINGEFVSGHRDSQITWDFTDSKKTKKRGNTMKTWGLRRKQEQILTEGWDKAEWGTLYFSGPSDSEHQSGEARSIRREFAETGTLKNLNDQSYRGIFENEPIFALSKSFKLNKKSGNKTTSDNALFTFALVQDPVVQFASARGLTFMRPLWSSFFATTERMLDYHYNDYETAAYLAQDYSARLAKDAFASGSQDYEDIVALSARQVLGATQFSGTPDDPIIFLKEISSNGNFQTVDVIFPAFPFFLYTNPQWLAYLLEPLIEHQLSGQYPNDYSMHDLGTHFPNATGHNDGNDEYMPVEECGNMLIMGLALANALKDGSSAEFTRTALPETQTLAIDGKILAYSDKFGMDVPVAVRQAEGKSAAEKWVSRSYKLWKQWTGYLVRESLVPANQLCTDDFAGWLANNTNLALKGIVGIKAMAGLAGIIGEKDDVKHYNEIAAHYIDKWQDYGLSRDRTHAKLAYTWYGSWSTLYNLFADALLCFHLPAEKASLGPSRFWSEDDILLGENKKSSKTFIPDDIYTMQSDWYHAVLQKYGLPLDSRHLYTKSDWEFFAAAVASKSVRTEILTHVATWVNETDTDHPLTDLYDTEGRGGFPGIMFTARPVVGGHFAFLALERACGGKAVDGLKFLDEAEAHAAIDVEAVLMADILEHEGGSEPVDEVEEL